LQGSAKVSCRKTALKSQALNRCDRPLRFRALLTASAAAACCSVSGVSRRGYFPRGRRCRRRPRPGPGSEVLGLTAFLAIADDRGVARLGGFSARRPWPHCIPISRLPLRCDHRAQPACDMKPWPAGPLPPRVRPARLCAAVAGGIWPTRR
jgi:hypothetical protein